MIKSKENNSEKNTFSDIITPKTLWAFILIAVLSSIFTLLLSSLFFPKERNLYRVPQNREVGRTSSDANIEMGEFNSAIKTAANSILPSIIQLNVESTPDPNAQNNLFDLFQQAPPPPKDEEPLVRSSGSGVILDRQGDTFFAITNHHVIDRAKTIQINTFFDEIYEAKIIGADPRLDIALISFDAPNNENLVVAVRGDSDTVEVGDWVLAAGSPLNLQSTVTAGIISAIGREDGPDSVLSDFIQTDAAINRGNSGGALINLKGELIGINTWIASSSSGGSIGLGFAIPINNTYSALNAFMSGEEREYGWLGVYIQDLSETAGLFGLPLKDYDEFYNSLGIPSEEGAFISGVIPNSPADKGGFLAGDFVTAIDGTAIKSSRSLQRRVANLTVGEKIKFDIIRFGEEESLTITIGKRLSIEEEEENPSVSWPGVSILPVSLAKKIINIDSTSNEGLYVLASSKDSASYIAGVRSDDIITHIRGVKVNTLKEFYEELGKSRTLSYTLLREGLSLTTPEVDFN